ncbi:MAG: type I-E CRISPR-associated protein Cas6/Cse3/CasE [Gemmatimonadaceae bacterium]|nr:type I-E CRISPR-associated protein Cas6/Cse3/CasE [Gemmatimonadaceae bacterium]
MSPLYFTRASLCRTAPARALRSMLLPSDDSARLMAGHKLVWTLFGDSPERARDFLWREADRGVYYLLSRRVPVDRHGLFELDEPKPFAPALAAGDRLAFTLRVNATVARGGGPGRRGKPCDIVMDALHSIDRTARRAARARVIREAARRWLVAQGTKSGFSLAAADPAAEIDRTGGDGPDGGRDGDDGGTLLRVLGHRTMRIDRQGSLAAVGVLDLEGVLVVQDPDCFLEAVARGFGRAKAFGCGLMLIRRV